MAKEKNSFVIYKDWYQLITHLTYEEKGRLITAIFDYHCDGIITEFDDNKFLQGFFNYFLSTFIRDDEKYQQTCERNRQSIKKRWEKENTKEYERIETNTNYTDNDNDNDNDTYNDIDNDTDTDIDDDTDTDF